MADEVQISGKTYISSKRAAELVGYAQDYIGQLAREGLIDAQRIGGLWYAQEESILEHKKKADEYIPTPPTKHAPSEVDSIIGLDGKEYVSAARAAEITGYHRDYVGQLARTKRVPSQQVGNRWYVDRTGLETHKEEKDALLAAVQAQAVGLKRSPENGQKSTITHDMGKTYFTYTSHVPNKPLFPEIPAQEKSYAPAMKEPEHRIPIYVKSVPVKNATNVPPYAHRENKKIESVRPSGMTSKHNSFTALLIGIVITFGTGAYLFGGMFLPESFLSKKSDITKRGVGIYLSSVVVFIDGVADTLEQYIIPEIEYRPR